MKTLTHDSAQEACQELVEKKSGIDGYDALEVVKKNFQRLWDDHDNLKQGFIDFSEGYKLLQEISAV